MTKVDFYLLLGTDQRSEGDHFACRLVDKAFRAGSSILLCSSSKQHADELDTLLWTFPISGFIPHTVDPDLQSKVKIDYNASDSYHDDCLINLSSTVPDYSARFRRICEIVVYSEEARAHSRQRFKYYKDRGFPIETHEIKP
ncbi:MAG: DNA polymerase III subunit chi [Pseudomonadales bacterium]